MDKQEQGTTAEREAASGSGTNPRSAAIAERGIRTGADFAGLMSALMGDIISGRVTPGVGNAACNAGGKLLRIVEMQHKFGTQNGNQGDRVLTLVSADTKLT